MAGDDNNRYDTRTLIAAGLAFGALALILYFLPPIMMAAGAVSPWLAAVVVGAVMILPFAGLWLHARMKRKGK